MKRVLARARVPIAAHDFRYARGHIVIRLSLPSTQPAHRAGSQRGFVDHPSVATSCQDR